MPVQQTPSIYLRNQNMRRNTRFLVTGNGERYYILNVVRIPEKIFLERFPVGDKIKAFSISQQKGDNIVSAAL